MSVTAVDSKPQHNFIWSFQPIVYSMRIIGIDLDSSQSRSWLQQGLSAGFGIALLVYSVVAYATSKFLSAPVGGEPSTALLYSYVEFYSLVISNILLNVISFTWLLLKWKPMWTKMVTLQDSLHLPVNFHRDNRKFFTAFVFVVFVVVI